MATNKATNPNIDKSDLVNFPNGRIKDNTGSGDGTPVNREIYSDIHEYFAKLMRLAAITYNDLPDNEGIGYQLVDAAIALAGKNDFITQIDTIVVVVDAVNTNVISVPLKLSTLKENEALIGKVTFDLTDQTLIKGTEVALKSITVPVPFKNGDYVRFINTSTGVTLVRLADALNLDVLVAELNFLKAATDVQEYAGTSQAVATTPYTAQLAFFRRVCGVDSGMFLASHTRNGLLSAAQWDILNSIAANKTRNIGWFSGVQPGTGTVGSFAPKSGDIASAQITAAVYETYTSYTTYLITLTHEMDDTNYYVKSFPHSEGTIDQDSEIGCPVFRIISTTQFSWTMSEVKNNPKNLKIHIEVVQI